MKWRLADVTSIDPTILTIAAAGLAGFLLAIASACLLLWLGRARARRSARRPKRARAASAARPAKAKPGRLEPVLQLRYDPSPAPVPAILYLPAPDTQPEPVLSAEMIPAHQESLLDYLEGNIEPWPTEKPAMQFVDGIPKPVPLTEAQPVPVPAVARSHTPQAAKSIGLPEAVWERTEALSLRSDPIVVQLPLPAVHHAPQPAKQPASKPRKLGFIRLKDKTRATVPQSENSAVLYSRRAS